MIYDIISGEYHETHPVAEYVPFFSIEDLVDVCRNHGDLPVKFMGTKYTVGYLHSWRGSYDLPAISYEDGRKLGKQIADELMVAVREEHTGWKGGEYYYSPSDEFYVSQEGSSREYKVCGAVVDSGYLVLLTKMDPY